MAARVRIDMTHWEFFYTAISILFIGVLWGWALFGEPKIFDAALEGSNGADWIAAAGTWVIGYGAWKYARASHEHHVRQALMEQLREQKAALLGLGSIIALLTRVQGPYLMLKSLESKSVDWSKAFPSFMKNTGDVLRRLRWDIAERGLLSDAAMKNYLLCEMDCDGYVLSVDEITAKISGTPLTKTTAEAHLKSLRAIAIAANKSAADVMAYVVNERQQVSKNIGQLMARLDINQPAR